MILVLTLGIVLALGYFLARPSERPLAPRERGYLFLTPLPVVLALVLPSIIGMTRAARSPNQWSSRFSWAGAVLSAVLLIAGVVLHVGRSRRGKAFEPRLAAGLVLAALPVVLVLLIAVLYAVG